MLRHLVIRQVGQGRQGRGLAKSAWGALSVPKVLLWNSSLDEESQRASGLPQKSGKVHLGSECHQNYGIYYEGMA